MKCIEGLHLIACEKAINLTWSYQKILWSKKKRYLSQNFFFIKFAFSTLPFKGVNSIKFWINFINFVTDDCQSAYPHFKNCSVEPCLSSHQVVISAIVILFMVMVVDNRIIQPRNPRKSQNLRRNSSFDGSCILETDLRYNKRVCCSILKGLSKGIFRGDSAPLCFESRIFYFHKGLVWNLSAILNHQSRILDLPLS